MILKEENLKKLIEEEPHIECDFHKGLDSKTVKERTEKGLVNKTKKHVSKTYTSIIFTNLFSYFNILLFIIAGFMAYAGLYSGMFFVIILVANIAIGLIQDIRARRLTDKLRLVTEPRSIVIRDGQELDISTSELVFGDIVKLKNGNQIASDSIVVDGELLVNESLLTGESVDIKKKVGDQILAGSFITGGTAYTQINRVGILNYCESLRKKASEFKRPRSEIMRSTKMLFFVICLLVTIIGIAMVITAACMGGLSSSTNINDTIKSISGSLVAMIPSGMYLLTSLTLAAGVIRLAYHRMLVQELYCIEMLARVNVICFDKTGTLTDGTMEVQQIVKLDDSLKEDEIGSALVSLINATKDDNSTAKAILKYFKSSTIKKAQSSIPFSSSTKFSAVTLESGETYVMGALEFVFKNPNMDLLKADEAFNQKGYRTLIVAKSTNSIKNGLVKDLKPVAMIVIKDHVCDDAKANIEWFKNNGVETKIISGDSASTVAAIAREVGVPNADKYISLAGMSIDEVKQVALKYNVFGRVTPEQKLALIEAFKNNGSVVAMTGDGVNDILALKHADCSIAMARGSEAARDVAYLVALDSNFSTLPKVVEEGRRVINNLQRTCSLFLVKTIFAIVLSLVFLISSWFSPTIKYPFSTNNMYVWEMLTIGVAAFFLALQPNRERLQGSFLSNIIIKATPAAFIQIAIVLTYFIICGINSTIFSSQEALALSVISFTIVSYFILCRVCWPFDLYRFILFVALLAIGIGAFLIDGFLLNGTLLGVPYSSINQTGILLMILVLLIAIPLYFVLDYFTRKIVKTYKRRNNK
jgi:cation-transporting ATPase E